MNILVIRHVADSDPARFEVMRPGGKGLAKPVAVPSPLGFPVEGRPESGLLRELASRLQSSWSCLTAIRLRCVSSCRGSRR
jgi:hypothetical protein